MKYSIADSEISEVETFVRNSSASERIHRLFGVMASAAREYQASMEKRHKTRHARRIGVRIQAVARVVGEELGVSEDRLFSHTRKADAVDARCVAMVLCRRLMNATVTQIAQAFNRHHTTVLHSLSEHAASVRVQRLLQRLEPIVMAELEDVDVVEYLRMNKREETGR